MRASLIILALLIAHAAVVAQDPVPTDTLTIPQELELEQVLEDVTLDAEDSQLIDLLTFLAENPLDLNTASEDELLQIPGLTPLAIHQIITQREQRRFASVDELRGLDIIDDDVFARVRPFLTVEAMQRTPAVALVRALTVRHRTVRDLQERAGFQTGAFAGSPYKIYNRLVARSREFNGSSVAVGLLTEKDAGEQSLTDFVAGYADIRLSNIATRVVLGDFTVEAAEGLVFWRSIGFSKGSEVISSVRKGGIGIRPYLSTDENWYFRGVAAEAEVAGVQVSGFYSRKPLHATVSSDGVITSFDASGLFRTTSERAKRFTARHELYGGRVVASLLRGLVIGGGGYTATFSHEVSPRQVGVFGFRGSSTSMVGLDVGYTTRALNLFSEVARSYTQAIGAIGGMIVRAAPGIDVAVALRYYPKDFVSLYGYGFGESSNTQNESGFYTGMRMRVGSWLRVSTYYDQFRFPWRTRSLRMPTAGNDFLLLFEPRPSRRTNMQIQFRSRNRPANEALADEFARTVRIDGERWQKNYRVTFEYRPSITFRWRSRVEVVNVGYSSSSRVERGMLVFQDMRTHPLPKMLVDARVIVFETDSFDSRVYEFESDLRGTFSNPALFGKGVRWYVVARYEVMKAVDVSMKYAQTIKSGVRTLSSGTSLIQGDLDNRLSVQLDVVF